MRLPGLFVTGTDTGVGKTRVASAIARSLAGRGRRVAVLKPVATGASRAASGWQVEDAEALAEALGGGVPIDRVSPLVFEAPMAPPQAARQAGARLEAGEVEAATREALGWWIGRGSDVAVVEGVGGLLCPLAEATTVADLAIALDFPLLVVARRGLGTLNHTLLTVEAATGRGLRVAGVVLNTAEAGPADLSASTNAAELADRLNGVAVLAELPYDNAGAMLYQMLDEIDWWDRAAPPRLLPPAAPERLIP